MTRQEAIAILERLQEPEAWEPQISHNAYDALQMAIDALESAQPKQDREFVKLTARNNSNGRPYFSVIYLEFDDNGVGHDFEGYSSYSLDVVSDYLKKYFMTSAQPESCDDAVSRKAVIGLLHSGYHSKSMIEEVKELPPVQPEITDEQAIEHLQSNGCIRGKRRMNRKE